MCSQNEKKKELATAKNGQEKRGQGGASAPARGQRDRWQQHAMANGDKKLDISIPAGTLRRLMC